MKGILSLALSFIIVSTAFGQQQQKGKSEKYRLIKLVKKRTSSGESYEKAVVDQRTIDKLSEPLKALGAYYCCRIQSNCEYADTIGGIECELTTALGLGNQGSDKHIAVLKKWFPNDKDAQSAIDEHCWVGMPGSSNFLQYNSLTFDVRHDTVTIRYDYIKYSHGDVETITQKDIAVIKKDKIRFIKR